MGKHKRTFWRKQRSLEVTRLLARDGGDCFLCKAPLDRRIRDHNHPEYVTFDHVIPRSAGGLSVPSNFRLAHKHCNNARGSDPLEEEDDAGDLRQR